MTKVNQLNTSFMDEVDEEIEEIEEIEDNEPETNRLIYDPEKINIITREPTIEQLLRRINEQALELAPDFQRHANIWKDEAKSRLIESIIIRMPIPAFYIDATDEDKWLVVDGLQRLFALKKFVIDKELKLCGLEYLTNLTGKSYDQLERRYQRRIEETQVTVYLIEKGTPPEVKYNIFKRINTGGEPLSPQELRHALNPGKATHFLAKLADCDEFKKVIKLGKSRKMRMDDREFILGFLAFLLTSYKQYKDGNRDVFLNEALVKINNLSQPELDEIENRFKQTMILSQDIFGEDAFRKLSQHQTRKYPVNKSLFEAWSFNLSRLDETEANTLKKKKKQLIERFTYYVDTDPEFLESISQAAEKVQYRFTTIQNIIREVLR